MARSVPRLGAVQLRIMQVLWDRGQATAREITDELSREESISHSTVQTLLRQLEAKGAVAHEAQDRTFVFRPLYREDEVRDTALRDVLSRVFHGSAYGLMSHLLRQEEISRDELGRLKKLIAETEAQPDQDETGATGGKR
jgi:BlaI family transcriptional regulator, penicillinase repressor